MPRSSRDGLRIWQEIRARLVAISTEWLRTDLRLCDAGVVLCIASHVGHAPHGESGLICPSVPMSTISITKSCTIPVLGGGDRRLGPSVFKKSCSRDWPPHNALLLTSASLHCSGPAVEEYLKRLADTDRSLSSQVRELLSLIREYGPNAVAPAMSKTHTAGAFGADYIGHILQNKR